MDVKKAFGVFFRAIEKFRKNYRRAMETPWTTIERLKRDVENSIDDEFSQETMNDFLLRILNLIPADADEIIRAVQEKIDGTRAMLRMDLVGEQLLALYDAADAAGPVSPMLIILRSLDDEAVDVLSVTAKFDAARRSKGEKRARALLEAIPDLIERIYMRYLQAVWAMSFLTIGKWPSRPPGSLGALTNQVIPRIRPHAALVDTYAGHLRNAVAHRHVVYLPSVRSIELRDPPAKWQMTLTLNELESRLMAIWSVSINLISIGVSRRARLVPS